jgi:hypothetical protein
MVGIASAAIYSILVPISVATSLTLDDLVGPDILVNDIPKSGSRMLELVICFYSLAGGVSSGEHSEISTSHWAISNLCIRQPMALQYGKRPVYLMSL